MWEHNKDTDEAVTMGKNPVLTRFFTTSLLALSIIFLGFFFRDTALVIFNDWQKDEYSHGPLIVIVALLWAMSGMQDRPIQSKPSLSGFPFILAAILLKILGTVIANNWVTQMAIPLAIVGVMGSAFGLRSVKEQWKANAFLLFAIPLPPMVFAGLTAKMQLLSSTLGVWMLELMQVSVFQEGNIIDLGSFKLQVAEACSGLRYLFPLLSFSFLAAFLFASRAWARVVLIASALPITIVLNSLRIAIIGVTVNVWGIEAAEGLIHQLEGWVIFTFCIAVLALEIWILSFFMPKMEMANFLPSLKKPLFIGPTQPRPLLMLVLLILTVLGLGGQSWVKSVRSTASIERTSLISFPLVIDEWTARPLSLTKEELSSLQLDDYFLANYSNAATQESVNFYVAYYASQKLGAAPHSPLVCIPGAGWEIPEHRTDYPLSIGTNGTVLNINRALIQRGEETQLVYFWVQERGRINSNILQTKFYLFWDALTLGRSDGALIRLATPIGKHETLAQADERLARFAGQTLPLLPAFVPEKRSTAGAKP